MDSALDIAVYRHGQVVVVHPRGLLTVHTAAQLRRVLANELLDHGRVVVDFDGLQLGRASCVMIFPALLTQCGGWPSARIARVAVRDACPVGFPGRLERSTDSQGRVRGRGLELVQSLTTAWGVDVQPDGNTVWAELTSTVSCA